MASSLRTSRSLRRDHPPGLDFAEFLLKLVSLSHIDEGGREMSFLVNIQEIRDRARQKIEEGPLTQDYQLDPQTAINVLNEALATELVCTLRYRFHYFMATGIHSASVAA